MSHLKTKIVLAMSVAFFAASTVSGNAAVFEKIHQFPPYHITGLDAVGPLVLGPDGNLYGTTSTGGKGFGTVFQIKPERAAQLTTLYEFANSPDGATPYGGVVFDSAGNLYGTTFVGGANGYGTIFKLAADGTETTLYSFKNDTVDGGFPASGLILDDQGNLYGAASSGGHYDCGIVFEVTQAGLETILHTFKLADGRTPAGALFRDKEGTLYGTNQSDGPSGGGTVYSLDAGGHFKVLHGFPLANPKDGTYPMGGVVLRQGILYGTSLSGGKYDKGTVYRVKTDGSGEALITSFRGAAGENPVSPLILDMAGNLYATAEAGGADNLGVAFKLTPSGQETVLHSFRGPDGSTPQSALTLDQSGNLFGTTSGESTHGSGKPATIFELTSRSK